MVMITREKSFEIIDIRSPRKQLVLQNYEIERLRRTS